MATDKKQCKVQVSWGPHSMQSSQCRRNAVSKGYCKQHSPAEIQKRYAAKEGREEARYKLRKQQHYGPDAIRALKSIEKLLRNKMPQSALDVVDAWLESNKEIL